MPAHSIYLSKLTDAARADLVSSLWHRQSERCFLCNEPIDLDLQSKQLHIDHIIPIEKTFFSTFLYLKQLDVPLNHLDDQGKNPRFLERHQLVQLMNLFAEEFLIGYWDAEAAIARIEHRVQQNQPISEKHLAAHRLTREEIMHAVLEYVALVIKNFYAYTGEHLDPERLMQVEHPDALWNRLRIFLKNVRGFPCWIDRNLSGTVFGTKQSKDYWINVFKTGTAAGGTKVLTEPIAIQKMIAA